MKIFKVNILLFFVMLACTFTSKAQCNASSLADNCITKLNSEFNFVKSFPIDGQGGVRNYVENAYIFAKGTQYMIKVCSKNAKTTDGIVVSLYDQKRHLVSTSKIQNKLFSTIVYPCNSTGIYYIRFSFDRNTKFHCGGAVLGFKR